MKTKRLTFLLPLTFLFLFVSSCSEEGAKTSSEQSTSSDSTSAENVANEGNKIKQYRSKIKSANISINGNKFEVSLIPLIITGKE